MDKLMEMLSERRCYLNRDDQKMSEFLRNHFDGYIDDLKASVELKDNKHLGKYICDEVNNLIPIIISNTKKIVEVLRLAEKGNKADALNKAVSFFEEAKPYFDSFQLPTFKKHIYYRIRPWSEKKPFPNDRKELFHAPLRVNYTGSSGRYNLPGVPGLYLSSSLGLAWYECGKPHEFMAAKFDVPWKNNNSGIFTFIDFSEKSGPLMHSINEWLINYPEDRNFNNQLLISYLYLYPLRSACSVLNNAGVSGDNDSYILSQMLIQWISKTKYFDGILYESNSEYNEVRSYGAYNAVLATSEYDNEGFDKTLRSSIKISKPEFFDLDKFDNKDPLSWGMENISDDYQYF